MPAAKVRTRTNRFSVCPFKSVPLLSGNGTYSMEPSQTELRGQEPAIYQPYKCISEPARRSLESVHAAFARDFAIQLSAYLRSNISVTPRTAVQTSFAEYAQSRQPHSAAASVSLQPPGARLILDLQPSILFPILELMLGGKPENTRAAIERTPTAIEKQLLSVLLKTAVGELDRAWNAVVKVAFQLDAFEDSIGVAQLHPPQEPALALPFEVRVGELSGCLTLVLPAIPVDRTLSQQAPQPEAAEPEEVQTLMLGASVRLDVWLQGVSMQLRDLVQLREEYVIKFDHPTDRDLHCTVNGHAAFMGQVVSTGRKRAFLIAGSSGLS